MAEARRRPVAVGVTVLNDDVMKISESLSAETTDVQSVREKLRQRWELASVLNFLHVKPLLSFTFHDLVFEPVIGSDLKISAEDIENALIEQNNTLAQLHIALLKGILPKSKTLKLSDDWMITLSKTLSTWWPWVATGEFPLTGGKGYSQYDAVSYINDAMKNGTEVSNFRKDKLAGNENGIAFWYDGNQSIGHRLYKEVLVFENERVRGKGTVPAIFSEWETLATNLEEFNKIVSEFASSGVEWEVALSKSLESGVIPVLEKQWKKKQRAQLRQQREQMLLNGFRKSRITRSCRNQKCIDYRFDDYDKAITEAIQCAKLQFYFCYLIVPRVCIFLWFSKRKTSEDRRQEEKPSQHAKRIETTSNDSNNSDSTSMDGKSTESDAERNSHQQRDNSDDSSHDEYDGENEDDDNNNGNSDQEKVHSKEQNMRFGHRSRGLRFSERLAGIPGHTVSESLSLGLKNRLRQRPSVNTALESVVVPDSEDESSAGDTS
ncbi:hypothetical protein DH2020_046731 [Rehmannia glutinosa]|uniref:DDT domain-containing protein n=1 Tax=Rehmannia glutinosa TaxID=99300 RepID=A0ABR0UBJ5_REHGL